MKDKKPEPKPDRIRPGEVDPPTEKQFKGFVRQLLNATKPSKANEPKKPTSQR